MNLQIFIYNRGQKVASPYGSAMTDTDYGFAMTDTDYGFAMTDTDYGFAMTERDYRFAMKESDYGSVITDTACGLASDGSGYLPTVVLTKFAENASVPAL